MDAPAIALMTCRRPATRSTIGSTDRVGSTALTSTPSLTSTVTLTGRDRALLRAIVAGRCDLVAAAAPELRVDGLWYCDQARAHGLIAAGFLTALRATGRERGPAALTAAGRHALAC